MNRRHQETKEQEPLRSGRILRFTGTAERDVYNPAVIENPDGTRSFAARVELRKNATDATSMFFQEMGPDVYKIVESFPTFALEDPDLVRIGDELVLSGVEVDWDANDPTKLLGFRQIFYRGKTPKELREFSRGPERMKDIHLVELRDGRIGVYTRPKGGEAGLGRVGYTTIDSLNELTCDNIEQARLLEPQVDADTWEGVNVVIPGIGDACECHGIIGHVAESVEGKMHYVATAYVHNPISGRRTVVKEIVSRQDFPQGEAKRDDLEDVVFPGGLIRHNDGSATFYAGLNDVNVGALRIEDPFATHRCP